MGLKSLLPSVCIVALLFALLLSGCGGKEAMMATTGVEGELTLQELAADPDRAPDFGKNLVKNSSFERDTGGDGTTLITPTDWDGAAGTVVTYGAPGGFPGLASPGPASRGNNFLAGGPDIVIATRTQFLDVTWAAAAIDALHARCVFSAWVGGYASQGDSVDLTIRLRKANMALIRGKSLVGPTPEERGHVTGLVQRKWNTVLPKRTRIVEVTAEFVRRSPPYNDGYMDKVSLVLKNLTPVGVPASAE